MMYLSILASLVGFMATKQDHEMVLSSTTFRCIAARRYRFSVATRPRPMKRHALIDISDEGVLWCPHGFPRSIANGLSYACDPIKPCHFLDTAAGSHGPGLVLHSLSIHTITTTTTQGFIDSCNKLHLDLIDHFGSISEASSESGWLAGQSVKGREASGPCLRDLSQI
jgi:hypothetical protein